MVDILQKERLSMKRKVLFALIYAAILAVATLFVAEIAIRAVYPMPWAGYMYLPPQQHLFQYDSEIGWVGRKNASGDFANLDFKVTVHHDKYGFRNRNEFYDPKKRNFLIIGDSFGWGWGVADDEVVSQSIMDQDSGVNAYNLSAPGYGTDQQYLILRRFLTAHPTLRVSAVIVFVYVNDFEDNLYTERYGYPKSKFELTPKGDLVLTGVPVPNDRPQVYVGERRLKQVPSSFWRFSHLYNFRNKRLPHSEPFRPPPRPWSKAEQQQVDLLSRLLVEIGNLAESRGGRLFVVTVFPDKERRIDALRKAMDTLKIKHATFDRRVIPLNELWNDHHMNARGHRNLAREILRRLDPKNGF